MDFSCIVMRIFLPEGVKSSTVCYKYMFAKRVCGGDGGAYQVYLENITYADLTEDDLRLYSDQCFLNLFRLSQLILEYLLSVQDTLATSLEVCT